MATNPYGKKNREKESNNVSDNVSEKSKNNAVVEINSRRQMTFKRKVTYFFNLDFIVNCKFYLV